MLFRVILQRGCRILDKVERRIHSQATNPGHADNEKNVRMTYKVVNIYLWFKLMILGQWVIIVDGKVTVANPFCKSN